MGIKERKEREREARREEIIDAAEKVFFEKGLGVATMDEIAEEAELSKGTLYLYYKSKEDLYLTVTMRGTEIMYKMFQEALSTGEPTIQLIANLGEAYYNYFKNHRNYFRTLYFFENPQLHTQVSPEVMEICSVQDKKIWDLVVGLIRRGIEEGMLHEGLDPFEVGVMLWSNSNGIMRMMDRQGSYWTDTMGLNLESILRKSNAFLVEAMMTERAKNQFSTTLFYHNTEQKDKNSG
jgi:TetR/AcrR family transcriptional regulator